MKLFNIFIDTSYTFEGKHPHEKVIILLHRHWFILFLRSIVFIVLAFVPLLAYVFLYDWVSLYELESIFFFAMFVYFLIWWYFLFYNITMYLLDTWIITDHRVIDSEQHGFFDRTVAEFNLTRIEDVSIEIESFMGTVLKFGNIAVQTAGTTPKFTFKQVPNPTDVKEKLIHAHNQYMMQHPGGIETDPLE